MLYPVSHQPPIPPSRLWLQLDSCLRERWEKGLGEGLGVWATCLQVLASLQMFCVASGMTAPLWLPLCPVTSRSSTAERQGRAASCDNSVGGDGLQRWCWRRGRVSISAALQLPGDGDWKAALLQQICLALPPLPLLSHLPEPVLPQAGVLAS